MSTGLVRTIQVLAATLLVAFATLGIMWVLGLIEPAAAKASAMRIGGVLGICLVAALAMVAVFSIGGRKSG
jgi:hypothetical protein